MNLSPLFVKRGRFLISLLRLSLTSFSGTEKYFFISGIWKNKAKTSPIRARKMPMFSSFIIFWSTPVKTSLKNSNLIFLIKQNLRCDNGPSWAGEDEVEIVESRERATDDFFRYFCFSSFIWLPVRVLVSHISFAWFYNQVGELFDLLDLKFRNKFCIFFVENWTSSVVRLAK